MHENPLDQGLLFVAQLSTAQLVFRGTLSVDTDILVRIIE